MKRALMTFGNPFGLALYDKDKTNVADGNGVDAKTRFITETRQRASKIGGGLLFALAAYAVLRRRGAYGTDRDKNFQWWASYWPLLPFRLCTFSPNKKSPFRERSAVALLGPMS
jgi:hypothetical protein